MAEDKLTDEQVKNWRKVLSMTLAFMLSQCPKKKFRK